MTRVIDPQVVDPQDGTLLVVDASVGIKLFIEEPGSNQAHALFSHLADQPPLRLAVPDLFYLECANILWKAVSRWGLPEYDASILLARLLELNLQVTPSLEVVAEAFTIAAAHGITVYDAVYVALAHVLDALLVTADDKFVRALAESEHRVVRLADVA
jgi:predicted nucleic acid-binding protein